MQVKDFPILYKRNSKGDKILVYHICILERKDSALQITTTGDLSGGKDKVSEKVIKGNKNKGAFERAVALATTVCSKKVRLGYHESESAAASAETPRTAMLSATLAPEDIESMGQDEFPLYMSIKLNGLRGTYHQKKDKIMTRELKTYDKLIEIQTELVELSKLVGSDYLDFELYAPGYMINDQVSKVRNGDDEVLAYIFDVPTEDAIPFSVRKETAYVIEKFLHKFPHIRVVQHFLAKCPADVKAFYDAAVLAKEEGIMLNTPTGLYCWNNKTSRGKELRKVKPLLSDEYEIVGIGAEKRIIDGYGVELIDFLCTTEGGEKFKVTPASMGVELRKELYTKFRQGTLTVEGLPKISLTFRERTAKGKPFHIRTSYLRYSM